VSPQTVVGVGMAIMVAGAWAFMFLPDRRDIWPRTWVAAAALTVTSVASLAWLGRLGETLGPLDAREVAIGVAVGTAWLVATHVGYAVLCRLVPAFSDQVSDLYRLGDGDSTSRMVGPIIAMGVAEELAFRGVLQGVGGFTLALIAYTAVQGFEGKWALGLAALLGGAVWGLLFAWRGGLVAPIVAHVLWTGVLTFVWTLGGCAGERLGRPRPQATRIGVPTSH